MDKYETRLRIEEIEKLKRRRQFKEAARLADTIEWYRIKSTVTLYKIADLYKITREYEKSIDILEMAHDRSPYAKNVVFALCEIYLEIGEFNKATDYYREYQALATDDDPGIWILKYKMLDALDAGIDEKIEILEVLKRKHRSEEWEYELATLYHRAGLAEKCVEECNEVITWFGDGSFVYKAMELKMLHEPLTEEQRAIYEGRVNKKNTASMPSTGKMPKGSTGKMPKSTTGRMPKGNTGKLKKKSNTGKMPVQDEYDRRSSGMQSGYSTEVDNREEGQQEDYHVKTISLNPFNTMDLQAELANNIQDYIGGEPSMIDRSNKGRIESGPIPVARDLPEEGEGQLFGGGSQDDLQATRPYVHKSELRNFQDTTDSLLKIVEEAQEEEKREQYPEAQNTGADSDLFEGQYTLDRQMPVQPQPQPAAETNFGGLSKPVSEEAFESDDLTAEDVEFVPENRKEVFHNTIPADAKEVFFEDKTDDIRFLVERPEKVQADESKLNEFKENYAKEREGKPLPEALGKLTGSEAGFTDTVPITGGIVEEKVLEDGTVELIKHFEEDVEPEVVIVGKDKNGVKRETGRLKFADSGKSVKRDTAPRREDVDPDYVNMLPTTEEAQISGQLNIEDIMAGWEETKRQKEREFQENFRKKTMENTGNLFADFDKEAKSGLLATLENPALINSVTDQSTSQDFIKGLSVEDIKKGKQISYPEKKEEAVKVSKVIDVSDEKEVDPDEEMIQKLLDEDEREAKKAAASEKPESQKGREEIQSRETEEVPGEEVQDEDTQSGGGESAGVSGEETEAGEAEEELSEEERRNRYYGSVTQKISGNIWDEVDNVPVKETYADPEPDEVGATKYMPGKQAIQEAASEVREEEGDAESEDESEEYALKYSSDLKEEEEDEPAAIIEPLTEEDKRTGKIVAAAVKEAAAKEEAVAETEEADTLSTPEEESDVQETRKEPEERPVSSHKKGKKKKHKGSRPDQGTHTEAGRPAKKEETGFQMVPLEMEEPQKPAPKVSTGENEDDNNEEELAAKGSGRELTDDEKRIFGPFLYTQKMKLQILDAIETMTLAAYSGNLIITSDSAESSGKLAKLFSQYMKSTDANCIGKSAKIGAEKLNKKDIDETFEALANGILIVSHAGKMKNSTINGILHNLNRDDRGVEVILHDTKTEIRRLLERAPVLVRFFNCRVDIITMSPEMLAEYGKKYAQGRGYSIEDMAMLAFSGRISELQIGTHMVSTEEVKQIVDEAIEHVDKPGPRKLMLTMTGKRYDKDHRVILREEDFEYRR